MTDQTIDMQPVKTALSNVDGDESERVYCATFAKYLSGKLLPQGIAMSFMLFQYDVAQGKSGFPSIEIPRKLVGYPDMVYALLAMRARQVVCDSVPADRRAEVEAAFSS